MKSSLKTKIKGFEGEFEFCPIPLSKALGLNRKIEKMSLNALKALEALKEPLVDLFLSGDTGEASDEDMARMLRTADLEKVMEIGEKVFSTLTDEEFLNFVKELLQSTKYIVAGLGAIDITDPAHFDDIFAGNVAGVYPVMFKAMKYNNFTPFALAGIGSVMEKIGFSSAPAESLSAS